MTAGKVWSAPTDFADRAPPDPALSPGGGEGGVSPGAGDDGYGFSGIALKSVVNGR